MSEVKSYREGYRSGYAQAVATAKANIAPKVEPVNVLDIVSAYLKANGFDGLAAEDCGCKIEELAECCKGFSECRPGYLKDCEKCTVTRIFCDGGYCMATDINEKKMVPPPEEKKNYPLSAYVEDFCGQCHYGCHAETPREQYPFDGKLGEGICGADTPKKD